ncbi:MAG: epoxyqueuosine reductase [Firmicutes bacterium]|nr:epoxyqueuosine reductase [Bacillota bacterium]
MNNNNDQPSPPAETLKDDMMAILLKHGAAEAGVADLSSATEAMMAHAAPHLQRFTRALSFIIPFPRSVIEELKTGPTHTYLHYYRAVNTIIDDLALRITAQLEHRGYEAFPIPSSQRIGEEKLESIFSHRLASVLAGLGWIGKSGCLVNQALGPRIRLGTILTNAPLTPDQPVEIQCGNCTLCKDACPAGAIKGVLFAPDVPLSERLSPQLCDNYQNEVRSRFGKRICGICLAVCPHGAYKMIL